VEVFACTGMRWKTAVALRWEDVDVPRRSIWVGRSRPSSTGKEVEGTKGADDYYITVIDITVIDESVEPLRRLKECADAHKADRALTGERGGKLNYTLWRKHLDNARKTSGVSYTDHPCTTFARASCGPAAHHR